jgi:hypothetical protein
MTPKYTRVGYAPVQPVPFSHALHAGQLGIDCRYCHVGVDKGPVSSIPTAQTCMNCHTQVKADSPLLAAVRQSYETGEPLPWVKVHQLPDHAFFDHQRGDGMQPAFVITKREVFILRDAFDAAAEFIHCHHLFLRQDLPNGIHLLAEGIGRRLIMLNWGAAEARNPANVVQRAVG